MDEREFKARTKKFALDTIQVIQKLPRSRTTDIIAGQLLRSATSVGANYRAACRAKSPADMINKLKLVEEESDESIYWLELLRESGLLPVEISEALEKEGCEILAMTVASIKTLRSRQSTLVNRQS
ncbi:MAG TPA: four helix bundle protein [Anaerolineales bacterium]